MALFARASVIELKRSVLCIRMMEVFLSCSRARSRQEVGYGTHFSDTISSSSFYSWVVTGSESIPGPGCLRNGCYEERQ